MAPPRKVLQKVLAELGISSNRTFHDARRTAVTVAAHAPGVGVLAASRMANHADTRITEARYVVTADASVRLAVEAIAERLPLHLALASLPPEGLQPSPPITALSASAPADEVLPVRLPPQEQSDDSTET